MVNGLADRDRVWEIDHLKSNSNEKKPRLKLRRFNQSHPAIQNPNQIEKIEIEKRVLLIEDEKEIPEFCRRPNQSNTSMESKWKLNPKNRGNGVRRNRQEGLKPKKWRQIIKKQRVERA